MRDPGWWWRNNLARRLWRRSLNRFRRFEMQCLRKGYWRKLATEKAQIAGRRGDLTEEQSARLHWLNQRTGWGTEYQHTPRELEAQNKLANEIIDELLAEGKL